MSVLLAQLLRIAANCPDVRQAGPLMEKAADRIEKYQRELNTRTFLTGEDGRMMASLLERKQELETERDALRAELEAIKGQQPVAFYWQDIGYPEPRTHGPYFGRPSESALRNVDGAAIPVLLYTLPPATLSPEVQASGPYASVADALARRYPKPSLLKECNVTYSNSSRPLAEHGERQEAVAWIVPDFGFLFPTEDAAQRYLRNINDLRKPTALYATPQPSPDVRALVEAIATSHPRIDPNIPVPLDEEKHCCEHTLYLDRERLHKLLDTHRQAQRQ